MNIFDDITPEISVATVQKKLRIRERKTAEELVDIARPLVDARAVYKIAYVTEKGDGTVQIESQRFQSNILRKKLDDVGRVFPFVLTIGKALERRADNSEDILEQYYLDEIGNVALREARSIFEAHLRKRFAHEKIACMAPGSLKDWPIQEQKPLFELLTSVSEAIGVELTSSYLMLPRKSLSGIYFPTETSFFSCQLCPRERCDSRKARYREDLAREYGIEV
jgi:hypothetical protein